VGADGFQGVWGFLAPQADEATALLCDPSPAVPRQPADAAKMRARLVSMASPLAFRQRYPIVLSAVFCWILAGPGAAADAPRIVSLNPSLTSILVAIGAASSLVGVDDYSAGQIAEVADLPRVGGLFSPSLEAVVSLRPDWVVLVPSAEQRDFQNRLGELGIPVVSFENLHFDEVLANIERLGALVGRSPQAGERIEAIRRTRRVARRLTRGRDEPGVLLILQRDPLYVVGRGNFIEEMLTGLGGRNLAGGFEGAYPRVAVEWVVEQRPDVLIDLSPGVEDPLAHWSRWPSIPAVASGRVVAISAEWVSMPGPYLDRAIETLAGSLYGEEVAARIRSERLR
jgi:ABC-type Fe3+-hydroxamate transport system substrate-binding protein